MWKIELVALLSLSSWCLVMIVWLLLAVPWVLLQFVIVLFPDHTHNFLSGHSKKIDKTKSLMTNGSLMKVESIAECWSILQYF